MTIRHLKIFIAVAETGSMSKAAQKLFLSQPTVSQAIRELEVENLPLTVVIDSQGNNLYETGRAAYLAWRRQET